ncbi:hypothetical protein Q8A67_018633 [Cirrhinus molitorella]|uniref:Uncharacterized protein n=1 Tax=Cirrhinus molitorella TaxID=172907 RepID=A0AA88PD66_9TELE|nr:hypothetical protein Q8A67_018633 [Cirrhinus molitorella]
MRGRQDADTAGNDGSADKMLNVAMAGDEARQCCFKYPVDRETPADGPPRGFVTTPELVSGTQWECGSKMESASGGLSRCAVFTGTDG